MLSLWVPYLRLKRSPKRWWLYSGLLSVPFLFLMLQFGNLGNPRPDLLYRLWRSSHSTPGDRIDFCNAYRPWETGAPLKYADKFR